MPPRVPAEALDRREDGADGYSGPARGDAADARLCRLPVGRVVAHSDRDRPRRDRARRPGRGADRRAATPRPGRRGVQRGRRLGVPRRRRPSHARRRRVHAVTAVSPSLAGSEHDDCRALAGEWGLRWTPVETDEMARAAYRINDTDRCFHCKAELMDVARADRRRRGRHASCSASTSTTSATTGPGSGRPATAGAAFPLVAAGFTKADVRAASRQLGLRTWDKPAAACLASRVPYGTAVSVAVLSRRRAGRGRAAPARASTRSGSATTATRPGSRSTSLDLDAGASPPGRPSSPACRAAGYRYVTLDLEGFRSGNLNAERSAERTAAAGGPWGTVAAHEAGHDTQLLGRLPRRRHPGPGPGEGRARRRVGRRGLLVRRDQPGRLPRRQDRAHRDRHRHHQRVLAHGHRRRPDRRRLRLRQRRPVHPRARRIRARR